MRRSGQEIRDPAELESILNEGQVCRLAMILSDRRPYVVPLCYGHCGDSLYFHTAHDGLKLDPLLSGEEVCFQIETDVQLRPSEEAGEWSMSYRSVIGYGRIRRVTDPGEKLRAMNVMMEHYSGRDDWDIHERQLAGTEVLELRIREMTGKRSRCLT